MQQSRPLGKYYVDFFLFFVLFLLFDLFDVDISKVRYVVADVRVEVGGLCHSLYVVVLISRVSF